MIKKRVRNLWKMDSIQPKPKKLYCFQCNGDSQCVISDTEEDAYNRLTNEFIKRNNEVGMGQDFEIIDGVISMDFNTIRKL